MKYIIDKIYHEVVNTTSIYEKLLIIFIFLFLFSSTFSIAITQISYFTALFIWLLIIIRTKTLKIDKTPLDIYFLLFIIAEIISTILSKNVSESLFYLHKRIVIIPIIYLIYTWIVKKERLESAILIFFLSILLVSLYGTVDVLINLNQYLHFEKRLNLFSFYMTAGGLMMISSLMLLPFVSHKSTPKYYRIFTGVALLLSLLCLIFTFTRGSWLGFLAGALLISLRRSKIIFLSIILLTILIIIFAPIEFKDRIYSIVDPDHPNNIERIQMWSTGIKIFLDNPVFGIGDIGTEGVYKIYGPPGANPVGHLHNNFINLLVKLGAFGLIIVLMLFIKIFVLEYKYSLKNSEDWFTNSINLGAVAAFLGFQINGLFEWNFGDTEVIMFLYITIGLALSANKVNLENPNKT